MKVEKFRVKAVDDHAGRVAEVRTSKLSFQSPSRGATSTEYNYKKSLKLDEPFENLIGEYVARFNPDDIANFRARNGSYANRLRQAAFYGSAMAFAVSKAFPQHPQDYAFDQDTLRLLVDVQVEAGLDVATIPYAPMSAGSLVKHFGRWRAHCEDYGGRLGRPSLAAPEVPMYLPEEKFQAVMKALWDSRSEFPIVALTYASIREHKINYDFLRRNRDEATWLHMSQVPRVPAGATKAKHSEMHLPQIYGVDTVTTGIPWGGDSQKAAVDYEALRFFDKPTLSVPRIRDWKAEHQSESAACQCPACRGRPFSAIARETMEAASDEDRVSALFGVFRLHEVFESSVAFDEGRAYISENGFQEYLRERMGSGAAEFTA